MNPLTRAATRDSRKELRADLALSFIMGTVFAVLTLSFILKY